MIKSWFFKNDKKGARGQKKKKKAALYGVENSNNEM